MPDTSRPKKRPHAKDDSPDLTGKTMEIRLKGQIFHIHQSLICESSAFFKNAVKPKSTGYKSRPFDVPYQSVTIFKIYIFWLYSGRISCSGTSIGKWSLLARSYDMGERLVAPTFQQAIIEEMIQHHKAHGNLPSIKSINIIYRATTEDSPARRLMVDLAVWKDGQPAWEGTDKLSNEMNTEFSNDLLRALLDQRKPPMGKTHRPWMCNSGRYLVKG